MNSRQLLLPAISLGALLAPRARAADSSPVVAYSSTQVAPAGIPVEAIGRGTKRDDVLARIGLPGTRLSADVWIYWNYRCTAASAERLGYDALIITFAAERVVEMKIVNAQTLAAALNRRNEGMVAARSPSPR